MAVPEEQAEVAAFLAGLAGEPAVETHISAVFRGAATVWKLKKAVRLGFLDFSAVAERKRFLDREMALNAPYVPGLYRDVAAVVRGKAGLALGGGGPALDWVLRMARVPAADFLDEKAAAGRIDPPLLRALADAVATMHAAQVAVGAAEPVERTVQVAEGNARAAREAGLDPAQVEAWLEGLRSAIGQAAPLLRARAPLIRRAHGDLHLGNLLMWQGRPAPFDALEFDEDLATIDPGYDLAFLLMDLERLVSRTAANLVLGRYVARSGDAGLVGGLAVWLSLRAMIRAHVEAARGRVTGGLLHAALGYLEPGRTMVVAVGGLMGTGKSTLARAVAPGLGRAPGALVISSDAVRKRLHGAAPEQRLPASAYTAEAHAGTGAAVLEAVRAAAGAGHSAVVDATFLDPALRDAAAAVAREAKAPFLGVWLEAPLGELERRVAGRTGDASDADVGVLRAAAASSCAPADWMAVDSTDAAAALEQVQMRLKLL